MKAGIELAGLVVEVNDTRIEAARLDTALAAAASARGHTVQATARRGATVRGHRGRHGAPGERTAAGRRHGADAKFPCGPVA